jgi:hypothetical protein
MIDIELVGTYIDPICCFLLYVCRNNQTVTNVLNFVLWLVSPPIYHYWVHRNT